MESFVNFILLAGTGFIAYHGLTYRDDEGNSDFVRLFFGSIALMFFLRIIFVDILEIALF